MYLRHRSTVSAAEDWCRASTAAASASSLYLMTSCMNTPRQGRGISYALPYFATSYIMFNCIDWHQCCGRKQNRECERSVTSPRFWRSDGSDSPQAPIVATDVLLGGGETLSMFFSGTLLGAFTFFRVTAMLEEVLLSRVSVSRGVPWFVFVLEVEVVVILLPLFGNGFSFSSAGNLLGAWVDRCTYQQCCSQERTYVSILSLHSLIVQQTLRGVRKKC